MRTPLQELETWREILADAVARKVPRAEIARLERVVRRAEHAVELHEIVEQLEALASAAERLPWRYGHFRRRRAIVRALGAARAEVRVAMVGVH